MPIPKDFGPFSKIPGPFLLGGKGETGRGSGVQQAPPNFTVTTKVIVRSKFSANPGVLASGRRPDRPGS